MLSPGERVLLVDSKSRRTLVVLSQGGRYHSHAGVVEHDQLIGRPEGSVARSARGARFLALRPTLADTVLGMPRGAQVVYPKDLGAVLMIADVFPGARILEAGVGSGAMSMMLLRAGAYVHGYELRPDFAARAVSNVRGALGEGAMERYAITQADVYEGTEDRELDRMVLDLPEPWRMVSHASSCLRPGGILLSYLPSIAQVMELRSELAQSRFGMTETLEVLHRPWHVEGKAVRPEHRMVGHTGFLTSARLLADPWPN